MRALWIGAFAVFFATPALAGEATPAPQSQPQSLSQPAQKPARDMEAILRELRALDSSQDMRGDHVVGEELC